MKLKLNQMQLTLFYIKIYHHQLIICYIKTDKIIKLILRSCNSTTMSTKFKLYQMQTILSFHKKSAVLPGYVIPFLIQINC